MLDGGETIIVRVIHSRKTKMKNFFKELGEWTATLIVAAIFAYGFFSLLGLVLYLWWFVGVLLFTGGIALAIFSLLYYLQK